MPKKDVKFTNNHRSRTGFYSLVLSLFSLGWLVYAVCRACILTDQSPNMLGGVGVCALLLSLWALVLSVHALREEDVFRGLPKAALALALLMLVLWAMLYGLGISALIGI